MNTTDKPIATPRKGAASIHTEFRHSSRARDPITVVKSNDRSQSSKKHNPGVVQQVAGTRSLNQKFLLSTIRKGVSYNAIEQLGKALGASNKELSSLLSIPTSTLTRRKAQGRLRTDESDRVVRFASLKDKATGLMLGDNDAALTWLRTPLDVLGNETPLEHATTELGAREVEDLMGRLEHGVFS